MSTRKAQLVILCEDPQQAAFVRRFLRLRGWHPRSIRVRPFPGGRRAGEQHVRTSFPDELEAIRRGHVDRKLIAVIDGDTVGHEGRVSQLRAACQAVDVVPPGDDDRVAVLVPTRAIETWLAYLDGREVDEATSYPRLPRERDCERHVQRLDEMCRSGALRMPFPPSLDAACTQFHSRIRGGPR